MKKYSLLDSLKYKKWVLARDRALEKLHTNAQRESSDLLRVTLTNVMFLVKAFYDELKDPKTPYVIDGLDQQIKMQFNALANQLLEVYMRLRARSYLLAKASEAEILAQHFKKKKVRSVITKADLQKQMQKPSAAGSTLHIRFHLYLDKLRRRIISAAQTSAITADTVEDYLIRVFQSLPKDRPVKRPAKILKPQLMEAKAPNDDSGTLITLEITPRKADQAIDFIDEDSWNEMVDNYLKDYIPRWRGPKDVVGKRPGTKDDLYAWEFERDLTQDFVVAVREGMVDAAKDNGITDFVWIAVIDSKTDECCRWRDGLLTSEIEKQLGQHQDEDADCNLDSDGIVPPIHFNCRCTLAPATDAIPDKPDTGAKEFEEWINS